MMIIKINYYFQKKEKSLKIFIIKDLINLIYDNLKYVVVGTGDE